MAVADEVYDETLRLQSGDRIKYFVQDFVSIEAVISNINFDKNIVSMVLLDDKYSGKIRYVKPNDGHKIKVNIDDALGIHQWHVAEIQLIWGDNVAIYNLSEAIAPLEGKLPPVMEDVATDHETRSQKENEEEFNVQNPSTRKIYMDGGMYNDFSSMQESIASYVNSYIHEYLKQSPGFGDINHDFVVADYGCATGGNSLQYIMPIRDQLPSKQKMKAFLCDLPSNDWSAVENHLEKQLHTEYQQHENNDFLSLNVRAGSHFDYVIMNKPMISVGYSCMSLQWTNTSLKQMPGHDRAIYGQNYDNEFRDKTSEQAIGDLQRYLYLRSQEFLPGGILVIAPLSTQCSCYEVLEKAKLLLLQTGGYEEKTREIIRKQLSSTEGFISTKDLFKLLMDESVSSKWYVDGYNHVLIPDPVLIGYENGTLSDEEALKFSIDEIKACYSYMFTDISQEVEDNYWRIFGDLYLNTSPSNYKLNSKNNQIGGWNSYSHIIRLRRTDAQLASSTRVSAFYENIVKEDFQNEAGDMSQQLTKEN